MSVTLMCMLDGLQIGLDGNEYSFVRALRTSYVNEVGSLKYFNTSHPLLKTWV